MTDDDEAPQGPSRPDEPVENAVDVGSARPLPPLDREKVADKRQDRQLKKFYAQLIVGLMGVQLLIADVVFVMYAWKGRGWDVQPEVMQAWLLATVVELIGVVIVITRNLFPRRDLQD